MLYQDDGQLIKEEPETGRTSLHWPPVHLRIDVKILLIVLKVLNVWFGLSERRGLPARWFSMFPDLRLKTEVTGL